MDCRRMWQPGTGGHASSHSACAPPLLAGGGSPFEKLTQGVWKLLAWLQQVDLARLADTAIGAPVETEVGIQQVQCRGCIQVRAAARQHMQRRHRVAAGQGMIPGHLQMPKSPQLLQGHGAGREGMAGGSAAMTPSIPAAAAAAAVGSPPPSCARPHAHTAPVQCAVWMAHPGTGLRALRGSSSSDCCVRRAEQEHWQQAPPPRHRGRDGDAQFRRARAKRAHVCSRRRWRHLPPGGTR